MGHTSIAWGQKMIRVVLMGTLVAFTLSGCTRISESRLNPFNWFGPSQDIAVADATGDGGQVQAERRPLVPEGRMTVVTDARPLVASITSLSVDRTPSGAIVRATGLAPTVGYFNAQLVNRGVTNGVLLLEFRAQAPAGFQPEGRASVRQITAAYVIDASDLAGIRSVRVQAANNARSAQR